MSKPTPKEETILLDPDEDLKEQIEELFIGALSENDLHRILNACGFQILPIMTEDDRQNAPSSERFH